MGDGSMLRVVVGLHIAAGLTSVVCGATAMLSPKRRGRHPWAGRCYLLALLVVFATAVVLAIARPHFAYLLIVGAVALAAASLGYTARRIRWRGWLPFHITGMATSYIAMLTAFYVDNGPRLPVWKLLPPITFWFLPAAAGLPLLARALHRHTHTPAGPHQRPTEPQTTRTTRTTSRSGDEHYDHNTRHEHDRSGQSGQSGRTARADPRPGP